jgi:hypothetical protein
MLVFGDRIQNLRFQNAVIAVMGALHADSDIADFTFSCKEAVEKTSTNHPFRKLAALMVKKCFHPHYFYDNYQECPCASVVGILLFRLLNHEPSYRCVERTYRMGGGIRQAQSAGRRLNKSSRAIPRDSVSIARTYTPFTVLTKSDAARNASARAVRNSILKTGLGRVAF